MTAKSLYPSTHAIETFHFESSVLTIFDDANFVDRVDEVDEGGRGLGYNHLARGYCNLKGRQSRDQ